MTATNYDQWLFSHQGEVSDYCPHCNADVNNCICDEDYDLQQQLTELNSQQQGSIEYMRGVNQSKNGMR